MGNVRLGLVVVVIGDKILHGVVGEKLPELGAELGGQRFVVGQHQRGPLDLGNNIGHGIRLAGTGDAQQSLLMETVFNAGYQLGDGLRLITGGLIRSMKFKFQRQKHLLLGL